MNYLRKWWIAAAGAVVITAIAGVSAGVMAQTPVPGTDAGVSMLDRVAEKLGISSDTLSEAIETSALDEIDERVAAGELTQEEADAIKERIAEMPDDALIGPGGPGGVGPGGPGGFGPGGRGGFGPGGHGGFGFVGGESLAQFLGITAEELRAELQADGATLATVAESYGKSRDDVKAFLTSEFESKLDERVTAGNLSQEEADAMLADKTAMLDAMIDGEMPAGEVPGGGRPFGGRPMDNSDNGGRRQ